MDAKEYATTKGVVLSHVSRDGVYAAELRDAGLGLDLVAVDRDAMKAVTDVLELQKELRGEAHTAVN